MAQRNEQVTYKLPNGNPRSADVSKAERIRYHSHKRLSSPNAAGVDLAASENVIVPPASVGIVPTGLAFRFPPGTYGRIAPRSGLSLKHVDVSAGVVDPDYCGEVKVVLHNHSRDALTIVSGQRVAQLVCEVFVDADVVEDSSIGERVTERGSKGFGSTDDSAK